MEGPVPHLITTHFINSFNGPSRISLDIEGGTSLSAINGEGKTSYASATLLFFGCTPSMISRVGSGKPVAPYFFPEANSWIVQEYQRPSGKPALAAFSSDNQYQVSILLIDAGFSAELFLSPENVVRDISELAAYLDANGIAHSPRIPTFSQYRSYLFAGGDMRSRDVQTQALRRIYSVSNSGRSMESIYRICAAMMDMGNSNFKPIQSLICNRIEPSETIEHSSELSNDIDVAQSLFAHIRLMEKLRPVNNSLSQSVTLLEKTIILRHSTLGAARQRAESATAMLLKVEADKADVESLYINDREQKKEKMLLCDVRISDLKHNISRDSTTIDRHDKGMVDAQNIVGQSTAEAIALSLKTKNQDHSNRVRERNELNDNQDYQIKFDNLRDQRDLKINTYIESCNDRVDGLNEVARIEKVNIAEQAASLTRPIDDELNELSGQKEKHKVDYNNDLQLLESQELLAEKNDAFKACIEQRDAAKNQMALEDDNVRQLSARLQDYAKIRTELEQQRQELVKQRQSFDQQLTNAQLRLAPPDGSLEAWLHTNVPSWQESIGKVVDPVLLSKSSDIVKYYENNGSQGFYGMGLMLDSLPLPDAINPELLESIRDALEAKLAIHEEQLAQLEAKINENTSALKTVTARKAEAEARRRTASDAVEEADQLIVNIRQKERDFHSEVKKKRNAIECKYRAEIGFIDASAERLRKSKDATHKRTAEHIAEVDRQLQADLAIAQQECEDGKNDAMRVFKELSAALNAKKSERARILDSAIAQLSIEINELKSKESALSSLIALNEASPRIDILRRSLLSNKDDLHLCNQELLAMKEKSRNDDAQYKQKLKEIDATLAGLKHEFDSMSFVISKSSDITILVSPKQTDLDRPAHDLVNNAKNLLVDYQNTLKAISGYLNELRLGMLCSNMGTDQIVEWYQSYIEPSAIADIENQKNNSIDLSKIRSMTSAYAEFFIFTLKECNNTIENDIKIKRTAICNYRDNLMRVLSKATIVQNEINLESSNLSLPKRLRNLKIIIKPNFNVFGIYKALNAFVERTAHASEAVIINEIISLMTNPDWLPCLKMPLVQWMDVKFSVEHETNDQWRYSEFYSAETLKDISSTGLNVFCLILSYALVVRGSTNGRIVVPFFIDEVARLDGANISLIVNILRYNFITPILACPNASSITRSALANNYQVKRNALKGQGRDMVRLIKTSDIRKEQADIISISEVNRDE